MINEYLTIGILSAIIALITGWMFITSTNHYLIKCLAAAFVLALVLYNWIMFINIMAWPIDDFPPDNSYVMAVATNRVKHIEYLWIIDPDNKDKGLRTFSIQFNEKLDDKMRQALEDAKKTGGVVVYHRPRKEKLEKAEGNGQGKIKSTKGHRLGGQGLGDDSTEGGDVTVKSLLPEKKDLLEK